jgi:hypothetical protein
MAQVPDQTAVIPFLAPLLLMAVVVEAQKRLNLLPEVVDLVVELEAVGLVQTLRAV